MSTVNKEAIKASMTEYLEKTYGKKSDYTNDIMGDLAGIFSHLDRQELIPKAMTFKIFKRIAEVQYVNSMIGVRC